MIPFKELGLAPEIQQALDELGYQEPSPIQEKAIPELLSGHDEIGRIERDVKTTIGEWESPEERMEPAPRPRRREREKPAEKEKAREEKSEEPEAEKQPANGDAVKLFVNRGERSGIDEEDLRWALREGAVLPDEAIHDVRVLHRFSFVEVDPDKADRTVEFLDGTKLKGKEIRLEIAKS